MFWRGGRHSADRLQATKIFCDDSASRDGVASDEGKIYCSEDFEIIDQTSLCFGLNPQDHQKLPELQALKLEFQVKVEEEKEFCSKTAEAHTKMKLVERRMKTMQEAVTEITNVSAGLQRSVQKVSAVNMMLIGTLDALELQPTSDEGTRHSSVAMSFIEVVAIDHVLLHSILLRVHHCAVQFVHTVH